MNRLQGWSRGGEPQKYSFPYCRRGMLFTPGEQSNSCSPPTLLYTVARCSLCDCLNHISFIAIDTYITDWKQLFSIWSYSPVDFNNESMTLISTHRLYMYENNGNATMLTLLRLTVRCPFYNNWQNGCKLRNN